MILNPFFAHVLFGQRPSARISYFLKGESLKNLNIPASKHLPRFFVPRLSNLVPLAIGADDFSANEI